MLQSLLPSMEVAFPSFRIRLFCSACIAVILLQKTLPGFVINRFRSEATARVYPPRKNAIANSDANTVNLRTVDVMVSGIA